MSAPAATAPLITPARPLRISVARFQRALLYLTLAVSGFVFIEPSPYEFMMLVTIVAFIATGLRLTARLVPLALLLILVNIGYSISAVDLLDQQPIVNWLITSWFLAVTCVFFAAALQTDTQARIDVLVRGYMLAGLIAALAGIIGYMHVTSGLEDLLTLYGRARGTFKDPNVLGAFLILPAVVSLQRVVVGRFGQALRNAIYFLVVATGILLAFSRAAWGMLVFSSALTLGLMFLTTHSSKQRARIVLIALAVIATSAVFVIALLSIDAVADLFKQRASLSQSYDLGEQGRFGRHAAGALMGLDLPLGIGPLQFSRYFPEDTHNSFLNAFMSGGWFAGVFYPALTLVTLIFGFRHAFERTPWRPTYLAVYSVCVGTALESLVIDTDHWRHYFLLIGMVWGSMAAARSSLRHEPDAAGPHEVGGLARPAATS